MQHDNSIGRLSESIRAESQLLLAGCLCALIACGACNNVAVQQQAPNDMRQDHVSALAVSLMVSDA